MKNSKSFRAVTERDQHIFRHCPVPIWEEDIFELRSMIKAWKARGIRDLGRYLDQHPGVLRKAIRSIRVVDVNDATLKLYEVKRKDDLLGPLDSTLDLSDPAVITNLKNDVLSIAGGRECYIEKEATAVTPSRKKLDLAIMLHIPAERESSPHMLVTLSR